MVSQFHKIALLGATGNLGSRILTALIKAGFEVTAIQRATSKTTVPDGIKSIQVDLSNKIELASAFQGHDVVVSAVPSPVASEQQVLLTAAIDAGVKRLVPSEFSSNLEAKAKQDNLPNVREKLKFRQILESTADEGKITWSGINGGPFLDGGIKWGMLGPNLQQNQAVYHDGGEKVVCTTSTDDLALAVALTLKHPAETENKPVYVYSAAVTERKICDMVAKLTGKTLTTVHVDVEADYEEYARDLETGTPNPQFQFRPYYLMMYGSGYGGDFRDSAMNGVIGLRVMTDEELEHNVKKWLLEIGVSLLEQ